MESRDKDAGQYSGWWLLAIAALGAIFCALLFFGFEWTSGRKDIDKLGQMGDFFGGMLNPLVSALTLFVAISVWQLQKKELKATQKALDEQAKTAEQQRQEQRFFDLLNVYQRTVDSIFFVVRTPLTHGEFQTQYTGKEAIAQFMESVGAQHLQTFSKFGYRSYTSGSNTYKIMQRQDLFPFWDNETIASLFDHYFRVIFRILTEAEGLLSNQQIPDLKDQHFRYIKLFRAQLSRSELIILGFNLWLDDEGKKMLPLAEKYGLLKHLPTGHLRTELEKLHPQVFGRTRAQSLQTLPPNQPEANL